MLAVLKALKHAKRGLESGEHNKGGHRERAIEMANKAIAQTKEGIEAGAKQR